MIVEIRQNKLVPQVPLCMFNVLYMLYKIMDVVQLLCSFIRSAIHSAWISCPLPHLHVLTTPTVCGTQPVPTRNFDTQFFKLALIFKSALDSKLAFSDRHSISNRHTISNWPPISNRYSISNQHSLSDGHLISSLSPIL